MIHPADAISKIQVQHRQGLITDLEAADELEDRVKEIHALDEELTWAALVVVTEDRIAALRALHAGDSHLCLVCADYK